MEQTWEQSTIQCFIPNIKGLGLVLSEKDFLMQIVYNKNQATHDGWWTSADSKSSHWAYALGEL